MVTGAMLISPLVGVSAYMGLLICGQLGFGLLLDTVGGFGFPVRPLDGIRACGILPGSSVSSVRLSSVGGLQVRLPPPEETRSMESSTSECSVSTTPSTTLQRQVAAWQRLNL